MLSFRFCQHRAAQLRWQHGTEASLVQGLLRRAWFVQRTSVRVLCGALEARRVRVGRPRVGATRIYSSACAWLEAFHAGAWTRDITNHLFCSATSVG